MLLEAAQIAAGIGWNKVAQKRRKEAREQALANSSSGESVSSTSTSSDGTSVEITIKINY